MITTSVELEAWFVSSISKAEYPSMTQCDGWAPYKIEKNTPFCVKHPKAIIFFNNVSKCANTPFKKLTAAEASKMIAKDSVEGIDEKEYMKKHAEASGQIQELIAKINELSKSVSTQQKEIVGLKKTNDDLNESLKVAKSVDIEAANNKIKEQQKVIAKLNKQLNKTE